MTREKTFATWRENNNYGNWREKSAFCLAGDPDGILRIKQSNISAEELPDNAVRMDTEYDNLDAEHKIYAWLTDDGTMHYWTNADTTRLPDESRFLFSELSNVIEIDISGIDTSDIKDMSFMFASCSSLKSLDLSSFDTSNVTSMYGMFQDCSKLTSLDISNFDTSNVTDMGYMFAGCSSLTSLDVSGWNTSYVKNMFAMFYKCSSLTSLDLSNWDTSKVTDMSFMFYGCESLSSLDLSSWDTSRVTDMRFMFYGCENLKPFLPSEMAEACGMPALAKSNHEQKNKAARRRNRDQHER